ncbi:hypothetical protein E2C01_006250 [Portunus trituberculatus]|uniref:Uncharacterized protein n=1 Tax=Portunus trituberculatus TaxID=210409 RepID=A0A5B7CUQ6_PORTR|nr:hypothetical protein [Portunus trituberculatus]
MQQLTNTFTPSFHWYTLDLYTSVHVCLGIASGQEYEDASSTRTPHSLGSLVHFWVAEIDLIIIYYFLGGDGARMVAVRWPNRYTQWCRLQVVVAVHVGIVLYIVPVWLALGGVMGFQLFREEGSVMDMKNNRGGGAFTVTIYVLYYAVPYLVTLSASIVIVRRVMEDFCTCQASIGQQDSRAAGQQGSVALLPPAHMTEGVFFVVQMINTCNGLQNEYIPWTKHKLRTSLSFLLIKHKHITSFPLLQQKQVFGNVATSSLDYVVRSTTLIILVLLVMDLPHIVLHTSQNKGPPSVIIHIIFEYHLIVVPIIFVTYNPSHRGAMLRLLHRCLPPVCRQVLPPPPSPSVAKCDSVEMRASHKFTTIAQ